MKNFLRRFLIPLAVVGMLTASASAAPLDNRKQGFGQGIETDGDNRPLGAVRFDEEYRKHDAYALSDDKSRILLTFDQGYENGWTEKILDTLKEKNVTAVFFLTGDYAKGQTALVQRMIDEGHMLGNHGMTHASMPALSKDGCKNEITELHNFVLEKYGVEMQYIRPPCGEFSESTLAAAKELGYKTIFWSFAYVDWLADRQPEPGAALEKLTGAAHGGAIYLLHSVSETNAKILGDAVDSLRAKGFIL